MSSVINNSASQTGNMSALPESPVKSPMKYHYFTSIVKEPNKVVKSFKTKKAHTLAPVSAEKQSKLIQRNWDKIKQTKLSFDANGNDNATLKIEDATVTVDKEEIVVEQNGRKRSFGIHERELLSGKTNKRLYPKDGTGITTLPGHELNSLLNEYKTKPRKISFQDFVDKAVNDAKNLP
jgi:hypothetical protein